MKKAPANKGGPRSKRPGRWIVPLRIRKPGLPLRRESFKAWREGRALQHPRHEQQLRRKHGDQRAAADDQPKYLGKCRLARIAGARHAGALLQLNRNSLGPSISSEVLQVLFASRGK